MIRLITRFVLLNLVLSLLSVFILPSSSYAVIAPTTTVSLSGPQGAPGYFRSTVDVTLTAVDPDGFVTSTSYEVNDEGGFQTYTGTFTLIHGQHYKIDFYSVDNEGNVEAEKSIAFVLDIAPAELLINFNPSTIDFLYTGVDDNLTVDLQVINLGTGREKVILTDLAGNVTQVMIKDKEKGKNAKLTAESITYNDLPATIFAKNQLLINYGLDNQDDSLKFLNQYFMEDDFVKTRIRYEAKDNESSIFLRFISEEKFKEAREGILLIQIFTFHHFLGFTYI